MSRCHHLHQKLVDGTWRCKDCDSPVLSTKQGIKEIVESGVLPQASFEGEGYFSKSLGMYVSNKADFREKEAMLTDPERNPEHVRRKTPKLRQEYFDECIRQGIVP